MKRVLTAAVVAVLIATGVAMSVGVDTCSLLDPDGWLYSLLGCGTPGGGGSGAGEL